MHLPFSFIIPPSILTFLPPCCNNNNARQALRKELRQNYPSEDLYLKGYKLMAISSHDEALKWEGIWQVWVPEMKDLVLGILEKIEDHIIISMMGLQERGNLQFQHQRDGCIYRCLGPYGREVPYIPT